ncbi:hypothetical protein J6590_030681 [Homalodisca vitripennis]|nr:hypothetical protein J6590_030681 [Homalodisca vitripennis]
MCVDQFNEYYANVGSNLANAIPPVTEVVVNDEDYQIDSVFQFSPVSLEQLEKSVLELKGGSAPGVDGIHTQSINLGDLGRIRVGEEIIGVPTFRLKKYKEF